ncbi:MAG: hypothetical protein ACI9EF_002702 [Pseudohongiellaceae bacterium]|jgi:hypothetical protein
MTLCRASFLAASFCLLTAAAEAQVQPVQVQSGRVVVHFLDGVLDDLGLSLQELNLTADVGTTEEEAMEGLLLGFSMAPDGDLKVLRETSQETFQPYGVLGGGVNVTGGFYLSSDSTGLGVDYTGFRIHAEEAHNDGPGGQPDPDYFFLSSADDPEGRDFLLCYVKVLFSPDEDYSVGPGDHPQPDKLRIKAWDLVVTPHLADKLGRPDLLGKTIGYGKLDSDVADYNGEWQHPQGQNMFTPDKGDAAGDGFAGTFLDVSLGILSGINQVGHTGTFPNGRVGLSMATTSCNVGDVNVTWLAAMNEDHPGIAMQVYREMDNRFEQVAVSWIKHGFFALSNSQCNSCQNPSPGTFLGVGCSDTYGSNNNADRFWLGPRDEWDPNQGTWECSGSFFDGTPVDCVRDETGSGNGSVDHRLEGFDGDFNLPGATYYYEAMYMVKDDEALTNNIGSRLCTMSWDGNSWNFSTPSSGSGNVLVEGPAVNRYGDMSSVGKLDGDNGEVALSVDVQDLGNGTWRYEYALFNWTLDRKVRQFSVPTNGIVGDAYFHDVDDETGNDWVLSTTDKNITWTYNDAVFPGHKVAGALEFGTLYNFGFTSDSPPASRTVALGIQESGSGGDILGVDTLGPAVLALSADDLSPSEGQTAMLRMQGGTTNGLIAVLSVNGVLITPTVLTATPVPFLGGELTVPVFIPAGFSGFVLGLIGAEFDTSVVALSNISTLAVE